MKIRLPKLVFIAPAGDVFKVNCSKEYRKALCVVILGKCQNGIWEWDWGQFKGAIYKLHSADKWQMTIQEAKAFGLKYTMCGICGRNCIMRLARNC